MAGQAFSSDVDQMANSSVYLQVDLGLSSTMIAADRVSKLMQQLVGRIESNVLDAFQQATADVVDHLAKEAATRVIIAERKAFKLEQELIHVKQQALAMLLRMKQSTDFQIAEAERECVYERKRADDVEGKLCSLQENPERIKNDLKKKGAILESMQKLREEEFQSSPWDDEEDVRNKKVKLDLPQIDMENLLLFAGVACDNASKICSSSMLDGPSKTCTAVKHGRCQSVGSRPMSDVQVASGSVDPLRNVEQHVQQCYGVHDKEAYATTTQEQDLLKDLAPGTLIEETGFQIAEKNYLKDVDEQQIHLSSIGNGSNKSTLKPCMHDSRAVADQIIKEVDYRVHPEDVQKSDLHPLFDSTEAESDRICRFRDNVTEAQASELLLPGQVTYISQKHIHSVSNATGVVAGDGQMSSLSYSDVQNRASGSMFLQEDTGACLHTVLSQIKERPMSESSFHVDRSFLKEIAVKDLKRDDIKCIGQSSGDYEKSSLKRMSESVVLFNPDESDCTELEQALRCLSKGIEVPECDLMHFKPSEEFDDDQSSLSMNPAMGADSNISERGATGMKNSQDQVDTNFCEKMLLVHLPGSHGATTLQGQFNGCSKFAKENKDGGKGSSEDPEILSDGTRIRRSRAMQPKNHFSSNGATRSKSNPKSSEPEKSLSLAVESSRDSRRLMQGARQLFLLAERKWN